VFDQRIGFDHPAFEAEAGAITLGEIQARAAAFDPLTQAVDADVRAISHNAWASLGAARRWRCTSSGRRGGCRGAGGDARGRAASAGR
jgi:hypothetical protein